MTLENPHASAVCCSGWFGVPLQTKRRYEAAEVWGHDHPVVGLAVAGPPQADDSWVGRVLAVVKQDWGVRPEAEVADVQRQVEVDPARGGHVREPERVALALMPDRVKR